MSNKYPNPKGGPPMNKYYIKIDLFIFLLLTLLITSLTAGTEALIIKGFRINQELILPGNPDMVYDAITGDISGWWDHSFSENPAKFYIEPKPGGGFYEIFDDSGDGVKHATVIAAQRGKLLRFEGPLGLSGRALHLVHTYEFTPIGSDSTQLTLIVNAMGEIDDTLPDIVDKVWYHFLFEQFKPYMEKRVHEQD
jgi:hypothetical protein